MASETTRRTIERIERERARRLHALYDIMWKQHARLMRTIERARKEYVHGY